MDSWLISKLWKPDVKLYVVMDTRYTKNELDKIYNLPASEQENLKVVTFPLGQYEREDAIIPLRNMYLAMVACNEYPGEDLEICLGATAGDRVLDKSPEFVEKANDLLNYLYQPQHWIPSGRKVKVCIDFKSKTKTQLLKMYLEQGGDIGEAFGQSFSCYNPDENGNECWQCKPCFRKFIAFYLNGFTFLPEDEKKVHDYIAREIMPQIEAGTYGRAEEELEIKKFMEDYESKKV